jgi:hypothetical protein
VFYTYLDELQDWAGRRLQRRSRRVELAAAGAD